jgi:ArsR family transcriptional regulator, arsenate/arsenite/antimonite-responsive transcriptional repressor
LVQAGAGGLSAGALAEALQLPKSSLSFHLAQLTNAGLIRQQRQGRSLIYSADYAVMSGLMGYLTENCCAGAACVPDAAFSTSQERNVA